jgi:hypothetical protein
VSEVVELNLVASGFLKLLDMLRNVFLQDLVFLRHDYLGHLLFYNALFTTAEYADFATTVLVVVDTVSHEDPYLVVIKKAILAVNKQLRSITSVI